MKDNGKPRQTGTSFTFMAGGEIIHKANCPRIKDMPQEDKSDD